MYRPSTVCFPLPVFCAAFSHNFPNYAHLVIQPPSYNLHPASSHPKSVTIYPQTQDRSRCQRGNLEVGFVFCPHDQRASKDLLISRWHDYGGRSVTRHSPPRHNRSRQICQDLQLSGEKVTLREQIQRAGHFLAVVTGSCELDGFLDGRSLPFLV